MPGVLDAVAAEPTKPNCKTCLAWFLLKGDASRVNQKGYCRRHSPTTVGDTRWPATFENDWCMEHMPVPTPSALVQQVRRTAE